MYQNRLQDHHLLHYNHFVQEQQQHLRHHVVTNIVIIIVVVIVITTTITVAIIIVIIIMIVITVLTLILFITIPQITTRSHSVMSLSKKAAIFSFPYSFSIFHHIFLVLISLQPCSSSHFLLLLVCMKTS